MRKLPALFVLVLAVALMFPAAALAHSTTMVQADLDPLNDSGASGTAMVEVSGNTATVTIESSGLLDGSPHAQHIHGMEQAISECPTLSADKDGDGLVNTVEGQPAYGPILVSLTTEGDTSPDSGLAVERFPATGDISFSRTIEVPAEVAENIEDFAIVQHGVDVNGSGQYDGDAKSELDPSLPLEATLPANCGALEMMPAGGVDTGAGGTATDSDSTAPLMIVALGGIALAGAFVLRRSWAS